MYRQHCSPSFTEPVLSGPSVVVAGIEFPATMQLKPAPASWNFGPVRKMLIVTDGVDEELPWLLQQSGTLDVSMSGSTPV